VEENDFLESPSSHIVFDCYKLETSLVFKLKCLHYFVFHLIILS